MAMTDDGEFTTIRCGENLAWQYARFSVRLLSTSHISLCSFVSFKNEISFHAIKEKGPLVTAGLSRLFAFRSMLSSQTESQSLYVALV
jgi:hypothetical protein